MGGLQGQAVGVTRAREQFPEAALQIEKAGAIAVPLPTICLMPPDDWTPFDCALEKIAEYDLLVFTSANAVRFFFDRARQLRRELQRDRLIIAVIGERTKELVEENGCSVSVIPAEPDAAEELAEVLSQEVALDGKSVLFPRALEGRDVLVRLLSQAGAQVDLVPVYQTKLSDEAEATLCRVLEDGSLSWLTFASPSAVKGLIVLAERLGFLPWLAKSGIKMAAIGRVTAVALIDHGLEPTVIAKRPTIRAMLEAMEAF